MAAKRSHALAPWWVPTKPASSAVRNSDETAIPNAGEVSKPSKDLQQRVREDKPETQNLSAPERLLQWADRFGSAIRKDMESGKRKLFIPMRADDFAALKVIARDDPDQRIGISSSTNTSSDPEGPIVEVTLMIDPRL